MASPSENPEPNGVVRVDSYVTGQSAANRDRAEAIMHEELDPARWWFVASVFPMIAGTLGPVANAFSICALGNWWRQIKPLDGDLSNHSVFIADPEWLTAINAIQLALALVSNAFLLLNMARRVRFSIAQPITIVGWYISAICLIALCATAAGPLAEGVDPSVEFIWSQAFYYGIYAAILYFVVATLMSVTFWGASSGHFSKNFDLTASQRTLMLQTILFLMYLLIGALIFKQTEGWRYLDAVYWADVTLFTVGFGDFATVSHLGRALLIPYALIGVISLGLVISSIRTMILERTHRRVGFRMQEMTRRKTVRNLTKRGTDDVLNPIDEDEVMGSTPDRVISNGQANEYDRRRAEFSLMRRVQQRAVTRRRWMSMAISTGTWMVLWLVGAVIFLKTEQPYQEGWNYFDSFYLCFVSLTTIGYGDRTPVSNAGKSFWVFWSLLALPTMTVLISNAGDTVVKFIHDITDRVGAVTILPTLKQCPEEIESPSPSTAVTTSSDTGTQDTLIPPSSNEKSSKHRRRHKRKHKNKHEANEDAQQRDPESHQHRLHHSASFTTDMEVSHRQHPLKEIPTGRKFHLLLVTEMEHIMENIRAGKKTHYTFEEWAWYLSLLGEDERNPHTHRRARGHQKRHGPRNGKGHNLSHTDTQSSSASLALGPEELTNDEHPHLKWSWVGNRSPISSGQDESDWILERLTCKLKESLTAGTGF